MTLKVSTILAFLALVLPFVSASHWSRRHQEVAKRALGDVAIHRRDAYTNARFTYYAVGLGACGQVNVASDFIVALNVEQYGSGYPGPSCFKSITIQYGGLTAQATIMDECMGCPYGGLDFSEGLFSFFADLSLGVVYGTWWFNDGSGGGGAPTTTSTWQPPPPTTTWQPPTTTWQPPPPPPPTTTWQPPPPPTTTSQPPPPPPPTTSSTPAYTPPTTTSTSTSSTPTTTSTPTSSLNLNTGLVSGLAVPTGVAVSAPQAGSPQNLLVMNNVLVDVGVLLSAAENSM